MPQIIRVSIFLLFLCFLIFDLSEFCFSEFFQDPTHIVNALRHNRTTGSPMILPLILTSTKSSRTFSSEGSYRRHLQKDGMHAPNAHMRLHDDLLSNGYYTTRLLIGTPPQKFALIVDTGSTVTYVPCATCEQCGKHQDPRFQPSLSSTYHPSPCNIDCTCDSEQKQCTYERQYAEMSSSSGVLGDDIISFGNESALRPQRAVFGCENVETGDLYSQQADGIMGLGRGELSVVDQLVDKGVISDSFSLCYGGMNVGGGAMVLGGILHPPDMSFSRSDPLRSPYYNIELKDLHVAGKPLQLNPKVFDGKHGTVLDSGTTYAYFPEAAFVKLRDAIIKKIQPLRRIHGPDPNYKDICFAGAGSNVSQLSKSFPDVDMIFGNGQKLKLTPENYLFQHSKVHGAYCLGIFQNSGDSTTLLGGIIVRNTLVTYDRENQRIGFWKTNCSELWDRLHLHETPAPAPAPSYRSNATASSPSLRSSNSIPPTLAPNGSKGNISPALSPSGLMDNSLSGNFQVGLITFDMSFNLKYSELETHIPELTKHIAHELEVDTSQVKLLNVTSTGDGTFTRWGIFPAGPNKYISHTTAMSIISHLANHRMHLPEKYGSYHLGDWKVEPSHLKRTWWKKNLFLLVLGISLVAILSFLTFIAWYIWRHKPDMFFYYRPVNSSVPEQEMQTL